MLVDIMPPNKNEIQMQFLMVRRLLSSGLLQYYSSIVSQPEAYEKRMLKKTIGIRSYGDGHFAITRAIGKGEDIIGFLGALPTLRIAHSKTIALNGSHGSSR